MKLKITEPGYAGFTGNMGQIEFVDAVSVGEFTMREALWIGGILRVVEIDEDGNELGPVSHAAEIVRTRNLATTVVTPLESGDPLAPSPDSEEVRQAVVTAPDPLPKPEGTEDAPVKVYTRAELEEIADKDGIKGLRPIGTPIGAVGTSIAGLIDQILAKQPKG